MGGANELFRKEGALLYLVDGDESMLLQRGEFVLLLVKHSSSPLAAVVAMVGDMQWPVGKDSFINKLGEKGFSFSNLPARLSYALSLDHLEGQDKEKLEFLFEEYSTYRHAGVDLKENIRFNRLGLTAGIKDIGEVDVQAAGKFWTRHASTVDSDCLPDTGISGSTTLEEKSCADGRSPKLAQRMQQARRMSAVAKLFARSVERGAINSATHVKKVCTRGGRAYSTEMALANVDAVAKVVDAVETAGRTLLAAEKEVEAIAAEGGGMQETVSNLISSAWTLNKVGLGMLFKTIASINSTASGRGSPSSRSASASHGRSSSSAVSTEMDSGLSISTASKSPSISATSGDPSTDNCNYASVSKVYAALGCASTLSITDHSNNIGGCRPYGRHGAPLSVSTSCSIIKAERPLISCLQRPGYCHDQPLPPRFGGASGLVPSPPPPIPPRFHGAITVAACDRSSAAASSSAAGVATALCLGSAGVAGAVTSGLEPPESLQYHVYRPQAMQNMGPAAGPPRTAPPRPRAPFQY